MTPNTSPASTPGAVSFSHMGLFVRDLDRMGRFYRDVLSLTETDRGALGTVQLLFPSSDPSEHHQVVLASGRPQTLPFTQAENLARNRPGFQSRASWQEGMAKRMGKA